MTDELNPPMGQTGEKAPFSGLWQPTTGEGAQLALSEGDTFPPSEGEAVTYELIQKTEQNPADPDEPNPVPDPDPGLHKDLLEEINEPTRIVTEEEAEILLEGINEEAAEAEAAEEVNHPDA